MRWARGAAAGLWGAVQALDRIVGAAEGWAVSLILAWMIVLAFVQVVLRNVFSFGFPWMEELLRLSVLWVGFLGASLAIRQGRHINIDVFSRMLPDRLKPCLRLVVDLVMLGVCLVFLSAAVEYIRVEKEFGDISDALGVPLWTLQIIFPFLFAVGSFRFALQAVASVLSLRGRAET